MSDKYDATPKQEARVRDICGKYNVSEIEMLELSSMLILAGFPYNKKTINRLKCQIEVMEFLDESMVEEGFGKRKL